MRKWEGHSIISKNLVSNKNVASPTVDVGIVDSSGKDEAEA